MSSTIIYTAIDFLFVILLMFLSFLIGYLISKCENLKKIEEIILEQYGDK